MRSEPTQCSHAGENYQGGGHLNKTSYAAKPLDISYEDPMLSALGNFDDERAVPGMPPSETGDDAAYQSGSNSPDGVFQPLTTFMRFPDISADRWEIDGNCPGQHLEMPLPPAYAGNRTGLQNSLEPYAAKTQKHVGGWSNGDMTDL